jgi:2',3'-cyclic-nucleotide 2'-phosphodiesterase (5'-nucleotidase family)
LAQTDREGGGFLQVSGVRVVWDPRRAAGGRVVDIAVGGRARGDDTVYSVAVPSYLVRGGDGYTAFARGKIALATDGRIATSAR